MFSITIVVNLEDRYQMAVKRFEPDKICPFGWTMVVAGKAMGYFDRFRPLV
jgi:hypothetical protein